MGVPRDSERTRARIIAAAGELFAEHGYHGVTVREIIHKANTHQSALNYHFAGKESLYREVLLHACESPESAKLDVAQLQQMPARDALQAVIGAWIRDYTAGEGGLWKAKLLDRECLEPSDVFQEITAGKLLPELQFVADLLGQAVGMASESTEVRAAVLGLLGQITTLTLYRQLLNAVARGLYDDIHRGRWLSLALTESAIAFVAATRKEP